MLDVASFGGAGVDADTAFAKAIAAIEKAAADARTGQQGVRIVLKILKKGAVYGSNAASPSGPQLSGFELNGNGAQLINTTRSQTLRMSASNRVAEIRDLAINYDPLPFTQGTITAFDKTATQITVKPLLSRRHAVTCLHHRALFKVMDRATKALKPGAAGFSHACESRYPEGMIRCICAGAPMIAFPASCRWRSATSS